MRTATDRQEPRGIFVKNAVIRLLRNFSLRTGVFDKSLFSVYPYMHEPQQLEYLLRSVRETEDVPGACVEVGCAHGATTVFLKKFLDGLSSTKRYIAIDTFSGFIPGDIDHEVRVRGKDPRPYSAFRANRLEWVERSLQWAQVQGVELIQADCLQVDYGEFGGIAFCLVDVDLYRPVQAALDAIYPELAPGGIIIVDDCKPETEWDGALAAYTEFVRKCGIPSEIVCEKLGVIRKAA